MGKGSRRRPTNEKAYRENYDRIFGRGKPRSVLDHAEGVDRLCKDRGVRSIARGKAKLGSGSL